MKKSILSFFAIAALCVLLCACGDEAPAAGTDSAAPPMLTAAPVDSGDAAPAETAAADENQLKAKAEDMIGKDVAELIAAIGEPVSSSYAPSCLGSGEDGEYLYDGFAVYTYKEGGTETVRSVE